MMLLVAAAVEDRAAGLRALLGPAAQLPAPLPAGVAALAPQLQMQELIMSQLDSSKQHGLNGLLQVRNPCLYT